MSLLQASPCFAPLDGRYECLTNTELSCNLSLSFVPFVAGSAYRDNLFSCQAEADLRGCSQSLSSRRGGVVQVLPACASNNQTDRCFADRELTGQIRLANQSGRVPLSDRADSLIGEYGKWVIFATTDQLRMQAESAAPFRLHVLHVVSVCTEKQVLRAYAARHIAVVQDVQPSRDRAEMQFPRYTVSKERRSRCAPNPQDTVTLHAATPLLQASDPKPTRAEFGAVGRDRAVSIDLRPKSIGERLWRLCRVRICRAAVRTGTLYGHRVTHPRAVSRPRLLAQRGGFVRQGLYHITTRASS